MSSNIVNSIEKREAIVGIVGLGYVGLPLLLEFSKAGFAAIGFDTDPTKVERLTAGESYIQHIDPEVISSVFRPANSGKPTSVATSDFARISECDAVLICVPTPLTLNREPDLRYIESTARSISPHLKSGQIIILESTTYPGTTEDVLIPLLDEGSGLKAGSDYHVAYSPEREDPNNADFSTSTIPKVVGGLTAESLAVARSLYSAVICETVPVSSCRAAEATKLMENIFRSVNIALVNELKVVFSKMDIDVWEVIRAASTKPFGFMPFYPGPGLGGHCIPIDPFYLTWKARQYGVATKFIELAGEINTSMPDYVIHQAMVALNRHGKALQGSRVIIIGLAYKKNIDDDRESPSYVLWKRLLEHGAQVDYYDPHCPTVRPSREHADLAGTESRTWESIADGVYDMALISTAHDCVDHDALAKLVSLVVDTRGVCAPAENVVRA